MYKTLLDSAFFVIEPCFTNAYGFVEYLFLTCRSIINKEREKWLSFDYEINFDKAQTNFLCFLIVCLIFNTLCVHLIWRFYGQLIYKKFKKPATPKVFEELSRSLAHLKLPKVHSPRI